MMERSFREYDRLGEDAGRGPSCLRVGEWVVKSKEEPATGPEDRCERESGHPERSLHTQDPPRAGMGREA